MSPLRRGHVLRWLPGGRGSAVPPIPNHASNGEGSSFHVWASTAFSFYCFTTIITYGTPTANKITSQNCQRLRDKIARALTTSAISSPSRISASCNLRKARAVAKYTSEPSRKDTFETRQITRLVKRLIWSMNKGCESADTDVLEGCRVSEYARYGVCQASLRPAGCSINDQ